MDKPYVIAWRKTTSPYIAHFEVDGYATREDAISELRKRVSDGTSEKTEDNITYRALVCRREEANA